MAENSGKSRVTEKDLSFNLGLWKLRKDFPFTIHSFGFVTYFREETLNGKVEWKRTVSLQKFSISP